MSDGHHQILPDLIHVEAAQGQHCVGKRLPVCGKELFVHDCQAYPVLISQSKNHVLID